MVQLTRIQAQNGLLIRERYDKSIRITVRKIKIEQRTEEFGLILAIAVKALNDTT